MTITQFKNLKKSTVFEVDYLENYVDDRVSAGRGLYFINYNLNEKPNDNNEYPVKIKGRIGSILFDEKNNEFFLGDSVFLKIAKEDLTISAPMLFFNRNKHVVSAPAESTVEIKKGYDLIISGKGFVANTLSKNFVFKSAKGIVSKTPENTETENSKARNE
ncbi:MAG: hypothetical protein CR988_05475 [Treponema sp.]|nr:MAG: hypothetical protein CR988_05475 [Treponema sp.]